MNTLLQHLLKEIDQTTRDFRQEFGELDADMLNAKPSPDTWSIGQNIHHLIVINESYVPVLEKAHKGETEVPFWGKWPLVYNFFGNMILKASSTKRDRKMKTFAIWEPSQSNVPADIVQQFAKHQEELKSSMESAEPLLGKGITITSPANKNIIYTLDKAFEIIVTHERRHLEQAREVKKQLAAGSW